MEPSDNTDLDGTDPGPAIPRHKEGLAIDDYRMIVRIGEGSFGEVWKAERGGFPVALKILNASINTEEAQRELKSLETLKKIHHKFLVHTENFWSDGDRLYIEMELADGGTLKERLKAYQALGKEGIPEDELLKYFTEAAQALDYLHGHRPVFLHRDIKPANILIVYGCAKLADFGLLRQVTGDNTSTKTQGGTPVYMAPESVKEDKFSAATDLWSFAVTYAELRQGKLPFSAKTQFQIFQRVCQDPPDLSEIFHPEERKVLLKALEKEPGQRFSSCGDFVFELNRVVPWTPALTVPVLATPQRAERKPGSSRPKGLESGAAPPAEPGTFRKKPVPTMEELALPATEAPSTVLPTTPEGDGTVTNDKARRSGKPGPAKTAEPRDAAATADFPAPAPITKSHRALGTEKKSAAPFAPAKRSAQKRNGLRVLASALVVAALSGVGFLVFQGWEGASGPGRNKEKSADHDKSGPALSGLALEEVAAEVDKALRADQIGLARRTVEQNQKVLPDAGEKLFARIDHKAKAADLLKTAAELVKRKDFDAVLSVFAKAKTPFDFRTDADRKASIIESARDGRNAQLVEIIKDAIRLKDPMRVRDYLDELTRFRDDNPRPDWKPEFQELPLPTELLMAAWTALLADKVVPADARRRVEEVKNYADPQQPAKFVLDPLYEKNLAALEALVRAQESNANNWDAAAKGLLQAMRRADQPPVSRNLWKGLDALERNQKLFRFQDLAALPPAPDDPLTKKASGQLFALVLDRLVRADNFKWRPDGDEVKKCRQWLADFQGPAEDTLALKAECLVRSGAGLDEIGRVAFPAKEDWYVAYVHALVVSKNNQHAEAADMIVKLVKGKTNIRKERMKDAGNVLRTAAGELLLKGRKREWGSNADAAKAVVWLGALLELESAPALDDLVDLTAAALKAETKDGDEILKTLPARLDLLPAANKLAGFAAAGKAFRADLDAVNAALAKPNADNGLWEQAIRKSERAQEFAYQMRKAEQLPEAAELNGQAVAVRARATFAKTKDGHAEYLVFEEAIKKARTNGPKKPADGFVLPVVVAALESALDYSKEDVQNVIKEGQKAKDLTLPADKWWEELRGRALVSFGDANLALLLKSQANELGEAELEAIYGRMADSFREARTLKNCRERYGGELAYKIGMVHFKMRKFKEAYVELKAAERELLKIPAAKRSAEMNVALEVVNAFLDTEALKKIAAEK